MKTMKSPNRIITVSVITCIMLILAAGLAGCKDSEDSDADKNSNAVQSMSEADQKVIDDITDRFMTLAEIPRQSGHEKAISDSLKKWGEDQGFKVRQNKVNDLIMDVPATEGYEDLPLTCLQGHLDMVCVAEDGVSYDPLKDPVKPVIDKEKGTMTADGTALGADDGIGVSMIMAIAEGKTDHGPLRLFFTTNEETDFKGAFAITKKDIKGVKNLLNIDGEESDKMLISSAAGMEIVAGMTPKTVMISGKNKLLCRIGISELLGGHSGMMISEGRCNGITQLCKVLKKMKKQYPYSLVSIKGGHASNAIPDRVTAKIVIDKKDAARAEEFISGVEDEIKKEYEGVEKDVKLSFEKTKEEPYKGKAIRDKQTKGILEYVTASVDGVYSMSEKVEGLVESSSNTGTIEAGPGKIEIHQLARSSDNEKMDKILDHQRKLGAKTDMKIDVTRTAKAWPADPDNRLAEQIAEIYKKQNDEEMKVEGVHAGLECGAFADLSEDLDIATIGPDVKDAHTTDEILYLASIPKTWNLLTELLVNIR